MKVKRFEGATLDEAVRAVKAEFGADAVVLSTRTIEVAGTDRGPARRRIEVTAAEPQDRGLIRRVMAREEASRGPNLALLPQVAAWQELLARAGLAASDVEGAVQEAVLAVRGGRPPGTACAAVMERRWPTRGPVRVDPDRPRVVALTGRPGEGRSNLARKLARRAAGVAPGRVVLVDADPDGTAWSGAAADPELKGVECVSAPDPWTLSDVLDTWSRAFFVVLDLPGFNPREAATVAAVAERVVTAPGAEVLLVASAATAPEETVAAAASLPAGGVSGLAITHLDSATRLENVVLAAIRTGLPLTFLSRGRRPALGLELATWEGVLAGVTAVASRRQETDEVRRAG